jgi:hypothetical protein
MDSKLNRREFLKVSASHAAALALAGCTPANTGRRPAEAAAADMILLNGRIATMDPRKPYASAVAIRDGRFIAVGADEDAMALKGAETAAIDLKQRTVIPGLIDSHIHIIRGGLHYNMELRWDGVRSLADAMRMLKEQAGRTPPPQWVRVVGAFSRFQFAEKRLPTIAELNAAAPDTPVFILHLYDRALLNRAAMNALGITRQTPDPPGGGFERDRSGDPTGAVLARPSPRILLETLAKMPRLSFEDELNSTRQFMTELNRLGVTSFIDAGGGFQSYPEDYRVIERLHRDGLLTTRIAYNLFAQRPKKELEDLQRWAMTVKPGTGDSFYRMNGAGENLVWSAADFEHFLEPRPELGAVMESELTAVARFLAGNRWPFRLHATYDESITRFLNIFESVNREIPFAGTRWTIDHAETISERNIERVRALGGGIAVQDRMVFQGEYFIERYGRQAAGHAPPIRAMLRMGVPVGAGTDATRVASHNPWFALYWLVSGKTLGGAQLYSGSNRLDRAEALMLYTLGSAWFSQEEEKKGSIEKGKFADLAALSQDYFTVPEEQIKDLASVLTIVAGRVVYAAEEFRHLAPPTLPASPGWSPVAVPIGSGRAAAATRARGRSCSGHPHTRVWLAEEGRFWDIGCDCFVG